MEYSGAASFYFLSIFCLLFQVLFFGIRWNEAQSTSKTFFFFIFGYFSIFFILVFEFFFFLSVVFLFACGVWGITEFYRVLPSFFSAPPHPSRSCGSFTEFFFNFYRVFSSFFLKPTPTAVKKKTTHRPLPSFTEFFFLPDQSNGVKRKSNPKAVTEFLPSFFFFLDFVSTDVPPMRATPPGLGRNKKKTAIFIIEQHKPTKQNGNARERERERERMKRRGKE